MHTHSHKQKGIRDDDWPRKHMACDRLDPLRPLRRRNRRAELDLSAAVHAVRGRTADLVAPKPETLHGAFEGRPRALSSLALPANADSLVSISGLRPL